jgi:hypothetical protein
MRSRRFRASSVEALLAVGLAGVAGGCGLVVGAGDYVVGDAGSNGSDSTSADTATEPNTEGGHEGDAASSFDSRVLNDGPSGLEGGSPEAGTPETGPGEGGDGSPPFLGCAPDGGPIPQAFPAGSDALQQLVRACVVAESCEPEYFDVSLAECITNDYFDAFPSLGCLATAKSCQDFYNCRGYRIADPTDCPSSLTTDFGKCVGTVATNCPFTGVAAVSNCAVVGGTCTAFDEDDAGDTAAGCKILSSCPDAAAVDQCANTTQLYSCASGGTGTVALGLDCPQSSTCRANGDGAHCYANGPSCTTPSAACANGDLSSCLATPTGNQARTYKCSATGLSCVTDANGGKGACVAPGCEHSQCVDSCDSDGETLHTCVGGAQYDIDCVMLGFTGCGTITPSGSSTEYAYCY